MNEAGKAGPGELPAGISAAAASPPGCINYICSHSRCLPKSSVPSQHLCAVCHATPQRPQKRGPLGHQPISPMLMVEGSVQAVLRQEKSLKSSRISKVLHIIASPKAGKAAAREGSDPVPTSPLVYSFALAQGGRQRAAPAPAPSACSMAHPSGVMRRKSASYQPRHLPACQACSLKQAVKHRKLLNQYEFYSTACAQ